jgi:hypothetical protein
VEKSFVNRALFKYLIGRESEGFGDVGEGFDTAVKQRCCEKDKKI